MGVSFTESEMLILSSLAYADTGKIKGCFDGNGNPIGDPPLSVNVLLPELERDGLRQGRFLKRTAERAVQSGC